MSRVIFSRAQISNEEISQTHSITKVENYDFLPSEECIEIWFFTLEEAKNLDTYPNIQEFLKHYNPENHVHA